MLGLNLGKMMYEINDEKWKKKLQNECEFTF